MTNTGKRRAFQPCDIYYDDLTRCNKTAINPDYYGCIALWRAVIDRAIRDAIGIIESNTASEREKEKIKKSAIEWFLDDESTLAMVCECADLNYDAVVDFFKKEVVEKTDDKKC